MDYKITDDLDNDDNNKETEKNEIEKDLLGDLEQNSKSKFNKKILLVILIVVISAGVISLILFLLLSQSEENNSKKMKEYEKIRLKNWEFVSSSKVNLSPEQISKGENPELFNKAPEDFYVCTAMGGLSGHTNKYYYETELQNVDKTQFDVDWWFRSHFELELPDSNEALILLHINGINYKSDVYVDGKLVATKDKIIGTFIKYTLDITKYLNKDLKTHYVAFKISRPHNQWGGSAYSNETDLAISFVDWNPEAPDSDMGIWQPVDVEIFNKKRLTISSAFINTKIIEENEINLELVLYIKNWEEKKIERNLNVQLGDFINLKDIKITLESLEEKQIVLNNEAYQNLSIKYDKDILWWPYQMGNQKMHKLTIEFNDEYKFTRELGLKQIESEYDTTKKIVVYKINKKKILLKGAGWTPDLFLRQSPENYYTHIKYVRDMGLNVIRLEGKSEGEEFYEYCDKMGILLIPGWNCADAWQRWKYWDESVKELSDLSVRSQIRKLSPHPSVIIFILGSDYSPSNGIEERWRKIFLEEKWTNEILSSAAVDAPEEYPTGVKMSGPYSWVPPNYFFLKESRNNNYGGAFGFLTEGGPGENPLRKGSIEKIYNETNLESYEGESWNYHCGNKGVFGDLSKIITPIKERLGDISNFDDFMRKSSAIVYEGHRAMFEAFECYRYESTGVIQWMLNNAWPSNIWHLYDYFFAPTPSYFATKKATEKIHVMYNYENNGVYLINNYFLDFKSNVNLTIYIISENGKDILENKSYDNINNIKADEIRELELLNGDYGNNYILHFEYLYENISLSNTYFLNKQMDVINYNATPTFYNVPIISYADLRFLNNLEKVSLTVEVLSKNDFIENGQKKLRYKFKITNKGKTFALLLEMKLYQISNNEKEMIVPIIWTDNYFSIRGENYYETTAEFSYDTSKELYLDIAGWNSELYQKLN